MAGMLKKDDVNEQNTDLCCTEENNVTNNSISSLGNVLHKKYAVLAG